MVKELIDKYVRCKDNNGVNRRICFFDLKENIIFPKEIKVLDSKVNLNFLELDIKIKDYFEFLSYLFPNCRVEDHQNNPEPGHPDFKIIISNDKFFYIEYKSNQDKISFHQLKWFFEHPEEDVFILYDVEYYSKEDLIILEKERARKQEDFYESLSDKPILNFDDDEPIDWKAYAMTLAK